MDKSISQYYYDSDGPKGHKCGYCKSKDTSVSHGMWTYHLTVEDYQDLLDRGWRRSGKYCYKPLMSKTCCPMYTISCHAPKFLISKSQKTVLKRMNKYLVDGIEAKSKGPPTPKDEAEAKSSGASSTDSNAVSGSDTKSAKTFRPGDGADSSKPPCRKAKVLRQERKAKKKEQATSGVSEESEMETTTKRSSSEGNPVEDFLKVGPDGKKPLEAFLILPDAKPGSSHVHNLEVKWVQSSPPSAEFKATLQESHALFKKYQMTIHHEKEDDCKLSSFKRFLCESPLISKKGKEGWPCDYGSYHQHYRIDGKLIAVGVVDVLPKCLSSVYVFYDPAYDFLNLGVYSALREIEMTRQLHLHDPTVFKFYYMGYYIQSCQKMRYKRNYMPSFLLCPESYKFMPIKPCVPKLDANKYSRLNDQETEAENVMDWLGGTLLLIERSIFSYEIFSEHVPGGVNDEIEATVKEYAVLVGPKVASRMLLIL